MSSLVRISGNHTGGHCGYCSGKNGVKNSYGMWAYRLTTQDYESLIDRGWRRSGSYCYKPTMNKMCCPPYPIRCDSLNFRATKNQKRLLKQINVYLNTGVKPRHSSNQSGHSKSARDLDRGAKSTAGGQGDVPTQKFSQSTEPCEVQATCNSPKEKIPSQSNQSNAALKTDVKTTPSGDLKSEKRRVKRWNQKVNRMKERAEKEKVPFDKLIQEYRVRREKRLSKTREKTLDDYLAMVLPNGKAAHNLEIKLVRSSPASDDFTATKEIEHSVYQRYQAHVHGDEPSSCNMKQFTRFLVDSPLIEDKVPSTNVGLGSFHQQYWLDGELIAVGVIDILPHCTSSVYFFYNPDFGFLSLGTYSALREISFTQELSRAVPSLFYYYMGYYIHSCPKMKYKGQYSPSFLACPETFTWVPIPVCRPLLDASKYSRLDQDPSAKDTDIPNPDTSVKMAVSNTQAIPSSNLRSLGRDVDADKIAEWAGLVGGKAASRMVFVPT